MKKRILITSFSACVLISYSAYNQGNINDHLASQKSIINLAQDSSITPIDSISKNLKSSISRFFPGYPNLEKEKKRRKKIREKYQKEKNN
jgi:hypothetical protein